MTSPATPPNPSFEQQLRRLRDASVQDAVNGPGDGSEDWQLSDQVIAETLTLHNAAIAQVEFKWWQDLWQFWIDPGNDDVEMEQLIKDRIAALEGEQ